MNHPQTGPPQVWVMPPTSAWATSSLVAGIISALGGFCLLAIPPLLAIGFGHIALRETRDGSRRGHGMAVAGLILGYLTGIPAVVFFLIAAIGALTEGSYH